MTLKRNILLTPGPATTSDSVKNAQVIPDICPREREFSEVLDYICRELTKIAGGEKDYTTVLLCGSGTAAVDAAINSVVPPDKKILILNNGAYGERMVKIAHAYSIAVVELKFPWDRPVVVEKVTAALSDPDIACVAAVHHETTTGLLNPIAEIGKIVKQHNRVFIVDAISSFAGMPYPIADYHTDFLIASSNKCLQGMPGCAFVICHCEELLKTAQYPARSFYLNLYRQYDYFVQHRQTPFTPAVQSIYALQQAIVEFYREEAKNRHRRYMENWLCLTTGMAKLGFCKLLPDKWESHILTTYLYPSADFDFNAMHDKLLARGFTIYPGKIGSRNTFRLANLGAIDKSDIADFLEAMREVIKEMGLVMF